MYSKQYITSIPRSKIEFIADSNSDCIVSTSYMHNLNLLVNNFQFLSPQFSEIATHSSLTKQHARLVLEPEY
jgi:hypothetical protein